MRTAEPQIPQAVLLGPPTAQQLVLEFPKATSEELTDLLRERMVVFQTENTALWVLARPSIVLTGAYEAIDRAHLKANFMHGDLRDGYGFYGWLQKASASDPIIDQISAVTALSEFKALDGNKVITGSAASC